MIDIHDPKNIPVIRDVLRQGQQTEFWQVVCALIDESVARKRAELMGDDLLEVPGAEYKTRVEILKNEIIDRETLKDLPESFIVELESPDQTDPDFDPYPKPEVGEE